MSGLAIQTHTFENTSLDARFSSLVKKKKRQNYTACVYKFQRKNCTEMQGGIWNSVRIVNRFKEDGKGMAEKERSGRAGVKVLAFWYF